MFAKCSTEVPLTETLAQTETFDTAGAVYPHKETLHAKIASFPI